MIAFDRTAILHSERFSNCTFFSVFGASSNFVCTLQTLAPLRHNPLSIMIDAYWIHGRKEHRMSPFLDVFATWNQSRLSDRVRIVGVPMW